VAWNNFPIPDTVSIPFVIGVGLEIFLPKAVFNPSFFLMALAILLLVISVSVMVWSVQEVGGHSINSPDALITSGPFSISRNPMYVSWFLVVIAAFGFTGSLWFVLCLAVALLLTHYAAILPEERRLEEQFGDSYVKYCESVRRYL